MMRKLRKWICVCLMAAMLLPSLAACKDGGDDETPAVELTIAAERSSEYVLVYPASATNDEKKVYQNFRSDLREKLLVHFEMIDDSQPAAEGAKEILLGSTNRPQSAEAYNRLGTEQVGYYVIDNQIAIVANFDGGFQLAGDEFISRYVKDGTLKLMSDLAVSIQCEVGIDTVEVSNTRGIGGDDPCVVHHTDGNYYYCWSDNGVKVAKIDNLDNIVKDNGKQVFDRTKGGFENVWAPELHYIDGEWYIYVAMCQGTTDNAAHRMYCLKGTSQDPTDPFELVGKVTDATDKWAIDGTVFEYQDELYTVWSGWQGDTDGMQNLYIAHMSNPWTIDSERVLISSPSEAYERIDTSPCAVNEGPAVLVKGDTVTIVYSANGSWGDNYCLTSISCTNGKLLTSRSWEKRTEPLLSKAMQAYGPGHCFFTTADDGSLWVMYHANLVSGTSWGGRSVRIQPVLWEGDQPTFGKVQLKVELPVRKLTIGEEIAEEEIAD